jgi:hypothetical protein
MPVKNEKAKISAGAISAVVIVAVIGSAFLWMPPPL